MKSVLLNLVLIMYAFPPTGYFGACNEYEMKSALIRGGPLVVGLEVYNDFLHYKGGIYQHTGLQDRFNPLEVRRTKGQAVEVNL